MEAQILIHSAYNTDSFLTLLRDSNDWFPGTKSSSSNSSCFFIFETVAFSLIGLSTIYVIYLIIRKMHLNLNTPPDNTIYNWEHCPICLNEFAAPIRANCGHAFCIDCLLTYYTNNPANDSCPLCRNRIQDFECLNKFVFDDKERLLATLLREELSNRIPPDHTTPDIYYFGEKCAILLIVITSIICYCVVRLF